MNSVLNLARQSIVDAYEHIIGYEFFYRDKHGNCSIDDARHATSNVLVNLLNQIGTTASFGDTLAFINTDGPLFLTDIIQTLPKEKIVFELTNTMKYTRQIHDAISYYHSLGYKFALDNASFSSHYFEKFSPLFPYMSYAKFDVNQTDIEQLAIRPNPYGKMKLIAQRIEFFEFFEAYRVLNFDFFQGFYFSKSHLITHSRIDPKNSDVLSLFALLQADSSLDDIYEAFKTDSALSLQLIQFLTSTNPTLLYNISSMREMIEKMGKKAFMQWLLLIIYSKSGTSALSITDHTAMFAQKRVETFLMLLTLTSPKSSVDLIESARLIALYSLLDKTMNLPIEEIVRMLQTSDTIKEALLINTGLLGRLYAATLKMEINDTATASLLLKSYGITFELLEQYV